MLRIFNKNRKLIIYWIILLIILAISWFIGKDKISFYLLINFIVATIVSLVIVLWGPKLIQLVKIKKIKIPTLLRRYWIGLVILAVFLLYTISAITLHDFFQTFAGDLGLFDQIFWNLIHGHGPTQTLFSLTQLNGGQTNNFLAEHFSPILFLLTPFYLLWRDPRMLIILENAIYVLGALPIYWLVRRETKNNYLSFCLVVAYLLYLGGQTALYFPIHFQVFAVVFLLFAFYFIKGGRLWPYFLFVLLALSCQENISLYVVFLGICLLFSDKRFRRIGCLTILIGLFWYVGVVYFFLPQIMHVALHKFPYQSFGNSLPAVLGFLFLHPVILLQNIFSQTNWWTLMIMGSSFGFLFIFSGSFWLLSLPILAENFLSTDTNTHIINFHYWAALAMALVVGSYFVVKKLSHSRGRILIFLSSFLLCIAIFNSWGLNKILGIRNNVDPPISSPQRQLTKKDLDTVINFIPKSSAVSAQSQIYPHLSGRNKIYQFPEVKDADYIILSGTTNVWPLTPLQWQQKVGDLLNSKDFGLYAAVDDNIFLFKRGQPNSVNAYLFSNKLYCFDNQQNFICQKDIFVAAGQPLNIKEKDGSIFYITPQVQLNLDAAKYNFLTLRVKVKTDFPRFQINFADREVGILTLNDFTFKNNNQFTDYYFNLSLFDEWGGTVDRLYLQFVPQDLEIESFALSPATPALVIKSLWQEFWTDQPERLFWINGLGAPLKKSLSGVPLLSGVPFIKYLLAIVLIVVVVLAIFKYRDRAIAKRWPKILLIIFLAGWTIAATRTLYSSYSTYLSDRRLWRVPSSARAEPVVGALVGNPEGIKNLYSFLAAIRANIPSGATIFMPSDSSYIYVLMVYNLVDQYQVVADINQADYLVLFGLAPPASPSLAPDFKLKFTFGPNQLIYQR